MNAIARLLLGSVLLLAVYAPVSAQTPDGETPAEESVCDVLENATPGLQGLCIAYCEAQDADIAFFSGDVLAKASHQRLLDNYNKKKTVGDPDMPCLRSACPCFDANDVADLGGHEVHCSLEKLGSTTYTALDDDFCKGFAQLSYGERGEASCFYRNDDLKLNVDGEEATCEAVMTTSVVGLTADEAAACEAAIVDGAFLNDVACRLPE